MPNPLQRDDRVDPRAVSDQFAGLPFLLLTVMVAIVLGLIIVWINGKL